MPKKKIIAMQVSFTRELQKSLQVLPRPIEVSPREATAKRNMSSLGLNCEPKKSRASKSLPQYVNLLAC